MRVVDFFFALRPLVLVPAWSFFLLGAAAARRSGAAPDFPAASCVCFTLVMLAVHLVNQVADRDSDRLNEKGFFLQRGIFTPRQYLCAAALCLAGGIGGAWRLQASPGVVVAAAVLGLAYSVPPLRLAARPGFDLAANAAGYGGIAVLMGAPEPARAGSPFVALVMASCMLAVGAVFLHTTLLDQEGDRRTGKRTSGVVWGTAPTRYVAAACALAALLAAAGAGWLLTAIPATVLALLALGAALAPAKVPSRRVCVAASAAYALSAGVAWTPFLPLLALLALATRIYYRRRFQIAYPAL